MDKVSYALGMSLGNNLLQSGITTLDYARLQSGITTLDYARLAQGIQDVMEHRKPEISYQEAQTAINDFFRALQDKAGQKNREEGQAFLAANARRPEVVTLPSGLQYEVVREGTGAKPKASDTVEVHYHGTLIDGTVFDSSVQRGTPATFGVTQVIPGWVEALQLMPVGSKWKLYIPSELAYGAQGAGGAIGPHTTLVFEVELLGIK